MIVKKINAFTFRIIREDEEEEEKHCNANMFFSSLSLFSLREE